MMEALGIKSLREGANGMNPKAPNAANYDESKVHPFTLPDPLVCKDGTKVTTAELWWTKRRPEIVEDFDREVYGRVPKDVPKVTWEVDRDEAGEGRRHLRPSPRRLLGHVDNSRCPQIKVDIQLTLTTPADAKGPVPVMMEFGFAFGGFGPRPGGPARQGGTPKAAPKAASPGGFGFGGGGPSWQQQVLAKGWGYAIIVPNSIQADNGGGPDQGDHRPVQQGAAAQAGRLGRAAGLGLGRQPRARLLRDRQGRRREAGRHRGALALRQGGARGDGLRPALRDRLHRLLGRGRSQAPPPQLRRAGREPHRLGRVPLDGRQLPQVRRPADSRTTCPSTRTS